MADALAQQLVEAKRHLIGSPRLEPPPPIATAGVTGGQPPPLVIRGCHHHQPPCQTTGVQNIRFVIPVVLGLASSTYACWCDLITSHYIPTPLTTTPQRHGVSHYSFLAKDG
jgi:hypothetical protein